MPEPIEDSSSIGGVGHFFKDAEGWLNDPDPAKRKANRAGARGRVANNFAGVGTTTLAGVSHNGIQHFNRHWRHMAGGAAGLGGGPAWWPNITAAQVNAQMSGAFVAALAPANDARDIRLRWDCRELNMNAGNSSFQATATVSGTVVWVDIRSPRAPGNVPDPMSGHQNYGHNASSNMPAMAAGPFTPLGDLDVANYDGIAGVDNSFDNTLQQNNTNSGFRESWSFFPIHDPIANASQDLVGLSYTRDSWRRVGSGEEEIFEEVPLHSETGYLLWDQAHGQAYRVIAMPRGVTVLAVAQHVSDDSTVLQFAADANSDDPLAGGILSNPLLAGSARTVSFTSTLTIVDNGKSFSYEDASEQQRGDGTEPFVHTDKNALTRV